MAYLEDLSLVYESILVAESADKRLHYLLAKYTQPLVNALNLPYSGFNNAIEWVLSNDEDPHIGTHLDGYEFTDDEYSKNDGGKYNEEQSLQLRTQWANKIIRYVVNTLDPTHGKYSEWFLRTNLRDINDVHSEWGSLLLVASGTEKDGPDADSDLEDFYKFTKYFEAYDRYKSSLPVEQRDISVFKTLVQFADVAYPLTLKSKKELIAKLRSELDESEYTTLVSVNGWDVIVPLTRNASIAIGGMTDWCTAELRPEWNYYSDYIDGGPLFIFVHNDAATYQLHFEPKSRGSDQYNIQFMDAKDEMTKPTEVPKSVWVALANVRNEYTSPYISYFVDFSNWHD